MPSRYTLIAKLSAVGLVLVASLLVPSGRAAFDRAQKPCPKGSVAAIIGAAPACLKAGQPCRQALDRRYHDYGFHCHTGRLTRPTKPKPPEVFTRKVDVGGYRLAIYCRGKGRPTVILESGGGQSSLAWSLIESRVAQTTRVCILRPRRTRGERPSPPTCACSGCAGRRRAAQLVGRGRDLSALRSRRLVSGRLLQPLVREALPRRGGWPRRGGRDADRPSGGSVSEPTRSAPHRSPWGAGPSRLLLPGGRRGGACGLPGSWRAAARLADARSPGRPSRLRGDVGAIAETGRTLLDILDPRARRRSGSRHSGGRSGPDCRSVPPGDCGRSDSCSSPGVRRHASAPPARDMPGSG